MSYRVFHITVSRARKARKPTAASNWGKQDKPSEPQGLQEGKGGNSWRAGPASESTTTRRRQTWFSLARYAEFKKVGRWNGGLE